MSTITLSANKINMMPLLIIDASNAVKSYKSELQTLKLKLLTIDNSVCNVDDVISSIKSSTQTQEDKIDALDNLKKDVNEFVADVVRIDGDAADAINQSKNDFYDKYEYLKPDIEKSWLEEKWNSACEWCKEHWKEILITVTIVIGAVLAIAMVTSVSELANFGTSNQLLINIPRTFEFTSGLSGLFSLNGSIINWLKEK